MKAIQILREELTGLYANEGLTMQEIAEKLGCSQGLVWKKLYEFGIQARNPWNATDLSKEKLIRWYLKEKLSTWRIQKRYGYPRGTVYRKLKEFGLVTRNASASHIRTPRKDFSGAKEQKAYLIGFARGDLRVRERGETVYLACGSTKPMQIELIKKLFGPYGNVWIGKPKKRRVNIEAAVNKSFSFLLGKDIPQFVYSSQNFFPFLAGFTDAEGSIFIPRSGRATYSLGNYNHNLLFNIRQQLLKREIVCTSLIENKIKHRIEKDGYGHKENYWYFTVGRKVSLVRLFDELSGFIKHADKLDAIQKARENIKMRDLLYGK